MRDGTSTLAVEDLMPRAGIGGDEMSNAPQEPIDAGTVLSDAMVTRTRTDRRAVAVPLPELVFATETMTGGSLATTIGGGQPHYSACGTSGYQVPQVQNGSAVGIQGSPFQGPPSYVNALLLTTAKRFVLASYSLSDSAT